MENKLHYLMLHEIQHCYVFPSYLLKLCFDVIKNLETESFTTVEWFQNNCLKANSGKSQER